MPVKETPKPTEEKASIVTDPSDVLNEPGFHVLGNENYCGTFVDEEQAQAYIDGQLTPQDGMKGEIVEGPAATE